MDDLIVEFITETNESLEVVDAELVKFEANPSERKTLDNIFRLVHTVKGTCGFLGLMRLEKVAHAAETLLGRFRDGVLDVTPVSVTVVLKSIDRIKDILNGLEKLGQEPDGEDSDLISALEDLAEGRHISQTQSQAAAPQAPLIIIDAPVVAANVPPADGYDPDLGRVLRPGEVSSSELEQAFQSAPGPDWQKKAGDYDDGLGRTLRVGEVSSVELEAAFQSTPGPDELAKAASKQAAFDEGLGRALRVGEVSSADLEAAFQAAPAPVWMDSAQEKTKEEKPKEAPKVEASRPSNAPIDLEDLGQPRAEQSIRVNVEVIEGLMTLVSEMVLTRNQLLQISRNREDGEFSTPLARLSALTGELQDSVMKTRMQPIGAAWKKLPRVVRDLSNELGKKIDLVMEGEATELDRQVSELIRDPLTHMVRNSADHGIESPEERVASGKPANGTIHLSAFHEGGNIVIRISDDGKGLNTARIREKLLEKGLISRQEADTFNDQQIQRFIFAPGFSTAAKVTSVSGRGVGMDVVRTNIEQIGGQIDLNSTQGKGTVFTIKIPLTLAIVSSLIVGAGGQKFAVPQTAVLELVRTGKNTEHRIERIENTLVLRLRNQLLPLVQLGANLGIEPYSFDERTHVMVIQVGEARYGLIVSEVLDTEEIVVKPLAHILRGVSVFSGATILGDGSVVLILDPNDLANMAGRMLEDKNTNAEQQAQEESNKIALLLFRAGQGPLKAVPLSDITRLEHIPTDQFEISPGRITIQYRGRLMPVLTLPGGATLKAEEAQPMLVFSAEGYPMGLMVDEIIDVVEEELKIELNGEQPGYVGTAIIAGKACDVIDTKAYQLRGLAEHQRSSTSSNSQERAVA